ncbi:MAG: putative bifunctional diguanylate cyclase/phosphodiesterase [Proteocatella sp.]
MNTISIIIAEAASIVAIGTYFKYRKSIKENKDYLNFLLLALILYSLGTVVHVITVNMYTELAWIASILYAASATFLKLSGVILLLSLYRNWNALKSIADLFALSIFIGYIAYKYIGGNIYAYVAKYQINSVDILLSIISIVTLIGIYTEDNYFKSIYGHIEFILIIMVNLLDVSGFYYGLLLSLVIVLILIKANIYKKYSISTEKYLVIKLGYFEFPIIIIFAVVIFMGTDLRIIFFFVSLVLLRVMVYKYINVYEFNIAMSYQYEELNEKLNDKVEEILEFNNNLEGIVKERTEKLEIKNKELYKITNIDPVTMVFNRNKFISYIDELIDRASDDTEVGLFFIDIDRFKVINDWYGHDIGDLVLKYTARRINEIIKEEGFLGRLGGDEFGVLIESGFLEKSFVDIANQIVEEFRSPFSIKDKTILSTVSIGIAIFPLNARRRIDLMKFADIALYKAKIKGRNRAVIYDSNLRREENRKLEIESRLKDGFYNEELFLFFQPQIDIKKEEIIGMEALVRWENKALGNVSPAEFILIAEENGIIVQIGDFVIRRSFETIKYLNQKYEQSLKIALNVSPKQFYEIEFLDNLDEFINNYDIDPSWIELEITENMAIRNENIVFSKLKRIKERGISIAIDDFGTGYSSFSYIKKYPIDKLKIAKELINGVSDSYEDYKMVKAILFMCNELNITSIAEGVEKSEQVDILKQLGCDIIQGYYYSKPLSLTELEQKYF